MATGINGLTDSIMRTINDHGKKETRPYDVKAQVKNIKDNTAYVHIPGGVDETPVALTINANVGDQVMVRVSGGKAWIVGNASNPPTDDTIANAAFTMANDANELSNIAARAADEAQISAIKADEHANEAKEYAKNAEKESEKANDAAESAINGLSIVERVVDVVNWIAEHGTYKTTEDEIPIQGKFYFVYDAETNTYSTVTPQEGDNPKANSWYELDSVEESVSNYVSSHLALVGNELHLQMDNTKVILSTTNGIELWKDGKKLASYGQDAVIGDAEGLHIRASANELGFYQGSVKVAYINGHKLYITKTVVLQQMDVGTPQSDGGLGQWSWKVHVINGQNNLYLKWNG